jgi:hypothetical protein
MRKVLNIGDIIGLRYKIIAISRENVMAVSVSKCVFTEYAVWLLNNNKRGVHSGVYFHSHKQACAAFAERVAHEQD